MRTAEEWGRVAVMLPGWRWMPGMLVVDTASNPAYRFTGRAWDDGGVVSDDGDGLNLECICRVEWPDPDDPATAGCLLALLAPAGPRPYRRPGGLWVIVTRHRMTMPYMEPDRLQPHTLGRACIAAAAALGRWPAGAE